MAASTPERSAPRISANDLARFMVSSDTARIGIVKRSKAPQAPPIIRYKDARPIIASYLSDPYRSLTRLTDGEEMFKQRATDPAVGALRQDDALKSIEVLHAIQAMGNQLGGYDFHPAAASQPKLVLGGIEVSVRCDLLVHGASRGRDQIGGAVLRMTQDDAATPEAREKRREMGLYVATLAKMHIEQHMAGGREAAGRLSMSIDIQHGEIFVAPDRTARRGNDLEAACQMIAALWDRI